MLEPSYKIFEYAKKRVYHFGRSDASKSVAPGNSVKTNKRKLDDNNKDKEDMNANGRVVLEEVLEEAPKWKVLREVLEEIEEERENQALSSEGIVDGSPEDDNVIVLVACKDEHSCMQLEECITNGPKKVMRGEWEKYLLSKVELHTLPKRYKKKKPRGKDPQGFGVLDGNIPTPTTSRKKPAAEGSSSSSSSLTMLERDALLAAASELSSKQVQKDNTGVGEITPQTCVDSGGQRKGRGRGRNKKSLKADGGQEGKISSVTECGVPETESGLEHVVPMDKGVIRKHVDDAGSLKNAKRLPPVHFHALESGRQILDILKPSAIIVYHPDIAFVREIEIYKAENPLKRVKVYFLFYEDSTEVQKFEASIRRENGAFESLIRQKSLMMLPVDQEGHGLGLNPSIELQSLTSQNLITRKGGGRKEADKEMQVIVDMREFMSSLPNVLHQKGMRIIPVTLEVGDYILSPSICVERKSIQDLFGSFASGRLYHQAEMMVRYYRIPVLLIEFSQDKSFSFQSSSDIGDDVTPNNIISKVSLLALHFPRLRIVWSRSLHATAEIFASLKANQDEPDEAKATRVGVPSEDGIMEDDVRAENYNTSAVEFLRRLPGVNDSNYRAIMDGCSSLADLTLLPVERLAELMGGHKAAKTLRDFLDAKYPTLL